MELGRSWAYGDFGSLGCCSSEVADKVDLVDTLDSGTADVIDYSRSSASCLVHSQ